MPSTLHPMLNVAVRAARAAGVIINRAALDVEAVRVAQKQANDFVTEVDQASEAAIIETLLTAYPGHGILAEESGRTQGNPRSEHVWIIDPLDGTTNFIHGFPVYCVSIALQVAGRVEQAVVYDPTRNDLFTATRGRGAFLNDRRIRVSKRIRLAESLIATGFPYRPGDDVPAYLEMMGTMMRACAGLRRPGAAALDLAYVAAGFSDGFFEVGLKPWDMAAGSLLVTEAGGLMGNFTGDALQLDVPECLAANPHVYAQLVSLLTRYSRAGQPLAPAQPQAPNWVADASEDAAPAPQSADDAGLGQAASCQLAPKMEKTVRAEPVEATAQGFDRLSPNDMDESKLASAVDMSANPIDPPAVPAPADNPPPRARLRAAPRRAPEPEPDSEPAPRPRRAAGPRPQDRDERPARPGRPYQTPDRERPYGRSDQAPSRERAYGKPAAKSAGRSTGRPAGQFAPRKRDAGPAPGGRPAYQDRPTRSPQAWPRADDRRDNRDARDNRADSPPARRPRRADDAPSGKPYTPRAPRSGA